MSAEFRVKCYFYGMSTNDLRGAMSPKQDFLKSASGKIVEL